MNRFKTPRFLKNRFPDTPPPEETDMLIRRVQENRDKHALHLVVESHGPYVLWYAEKLWSKYKVIREEFTEEDLVQELFVSLKKAIYKYRGDGGAKFSSYAIWYLKHYTMRSLLRYGLLIAIPSDKHYRRIRAKINTELVPPYVAEIFMEQKANEEPPLDDIFDQCIIREDLRIAIRRARLSTKEKVVLMMAQPKRGGTGTWHSCARFLYENGLTNTIVSRQRIFQVWDKSIQKLLATGILEGESNAYAQDR